MGLWTKFGCFLTGWNHRTLSQCSEASRSQLTKYTSALIILMLIWSVTGYCFADRYIGLPFWGCALMALFFVSIVIMIERQIILATKKTKKLVWFRGIIAVVMALVGSTIIDQTMFGKDIDKQMTATIEEQTQALSKERLRVIDEKLVSLNAQLDSLNSVNAALQEEVNAHPFIIQTSVTNTTETIALSDGRTKRVNTPSVTKTEVPNPKQAVIEANAKTIAALQAEEQKWSEKKITVVDDTRIELTASVGFLEELEAMWAIITSRPIAGVFYAIFFLLLMSLELFVVVSKMGDDECDYEQTVRGSQRVRLAQLDQAFRRASAS